MQFSDDHHTLNMYKALQKLIVMKNLIKIKTKKSIVTNDLIKIFEQVIEFYEVRVYNWEIATNLSRSSTRQ